MAAGEDMEIAKAGIEQLGETGREMMRLASGSSLATETSGLLADEVRFRRFKRQVKIVQRAERLLDEASLPARPVALKTLAPLLEWGGLEDDDSMVSRWANLLASAGSASPVGFHVIYPELLRQLEPLEASIIDALFLLEKDGKPIDPRVWQLKSGAWRSLDEILAVMLTSRKWVQVDGRNLQNLARLALCRVRNDGDFMRSIRSRVSEEPTQRHPASRAGRLDDLEVGLTQLGLEFSLACQPPAMLG